MFIIFRRLFRDITCAMRNFKVNYILQKTHVEHKRKKKVQKMCQQSATTFVFNEVALHRNFNKGS